MKLIADENIDSAIIAWLGSQTLDVISVREVMPGASDDEIIRRALAEGLVILTKDMDFGEMVFHLGIPAVGIILLRFKAMGAGLRLAMVRRHWKEVMKHALGNFIVLSGGRLRIRAVRARRP